MSVVYRKTIQIADKFVPKKFQPFWNHEAGKNLLEVPPSLNENFVGVLAFRDLSVINSERIVCRKKNAVICPCVVAALVILAYHQVPGPKTVFFWAPAVKWSLVIAGLSDLKRPADKISMPQSGALAATGIIWSRYSLVIIPKNWGLFSVNLFVAATGLYQCSRAFMFQREQKELTA